LAQGLGLGAAIDTAALAYLGDAVFELCVREMLIAMGVSPRDLSNRAKDYVSATAQAAMYHKIFPQVTQEEQSIMKRGRNLHNHSRAKNAAVVDYRHATGLETLFGFMYHCGDAARVTALFALCIKDDL